MAKISTEQLDDFNITGIQDRDILVYNAATENFEPEPQATEVIIFRRVFLLMGA